MVGKRVVVTGYGAVSALGENVPEIWDAILNYRVGYKRVEFADPKINAKFFSFMETNKGRYAGFPKAVLKMLPDFAKNALVASREALNMAFGSSDDVMLHVKSPFDIGAIIGTGWGGMDVVNRNNVEYLDSGVTSSFTVLMAMPNIATAAISMHWNMRGYQNTPIAACATGSIAIGDAYEVIKSGRAKVMLAGGSEAVKDQFAAWSIDVIQALSKEQDDVRRACCPFSANRSGFVLAEGAAVLCLEEYEHARARGATILGEITGYGSYSDAYDMTSPAVDLLARNETIKYAMRQAGRHPGQIGYVNLHGTSTPMNDVNETESIKSVFGDAASGIPMSSTKSYTGHLIAAAGSMETIFCLKAIETGIAPATIHLDQADPECDLDYIPNAHRQVGKIDAALNLSFGFGGANAALVVARV